MSKVTRELKNIWSQLTESKKKEYLENWHNLSSRPECDDLYEVWKIMTPSEQSTYFHLVAEFLKDDMNIAWAWRDFKGDGQQKFFDNIIQKINSPQIIGRVWQYTKPEIQKSKMEYMLNRYKDNKEIKFQLIRGLDEVLLKEEYLDLFKEVFDEQVEILYDEKLTEKELIKQITRISDIGTLNQRELEDKKISAYRKIAARENLTPTVVECIKKAIEMHSIVMFRNYLEQKQFTDYIEDISEMFKDYLDLKKIIWFHLPPKFIIKNAEYLICNKYANDYDMQLIIWDRLPIQKDYIQGEDSLFSYLRSVAGDDDEKIVKLCTNTRDDIIYSADFLIKYQEDPRLIHGILSNRDNKLSAIIHNQKRFDEIIEQMKDNPEIVIELFSGSKHEALEEFQDKYLEIMFELSKSANDPKSAMGIVWNAIYDNETKLKKMKFVLEKYGVKDNEEYELAIKELIKSNADLFETLDIRILQTQFLSTLSVEQLKLITCYPNVQEILVELDPEKYKFVINILKGYTNNHTEWTQIFERILENIAKGEYDELIESGGFEYSDDIALTLSRKNIFNLRDFFQIQRLDQIVLEAIDLVENGKQDELREKYPRLAEYPLLEQKKILAFQRLYGQSLEEVQDIVKKYGEDIHNLSNTPENEYFKKYITSLKIILETEDEEKLSAILKTTPLKENKVDPFSMEKNLKKAYNREYNLQLTQVDNLKKIKVKGLGKCKVYDAGVDFQMMITSVSPYRQNEPENFYDDWNRNCIASQGFCCSFIRNDMLGRADCPHLFYGFSNMAPDALIRSGSADMYSDASKINPSVRRAEGFYTPNSQINQTGRKTYKSGEAISQYNEMLYRRIQYGTKKQPDFIVAFGSHGNIDNLKKILQAAKEFKKATGKDMPIVYVDLAKIYQNEEQEINKLIKEYETTKSPEIARKTILRIKNNNVHCPARFEKYLEFLEQFTPEEIAQMEKIEAEKSDETFEDLYLTLGKDNIASQLQTEDKSKVDDVELCNAWFRECCVKSRGLRKIKYEIMKIFKKFRERTIEDEDKLKKGEK